MDKSIEEKQIFLRDNILSQEYDPAEFVTFLNSKMPIGDDLNLISYVQLEAITNQFIALKHEQKSDNSFEPICQGPSSLLQVSQIRKEEQSQYNPSNISESKAKQTKKFKPRAILFTKYVPNLMEIECHKTFQCRKVVDKYDHIPKIKCVVSNPERKNTGGLFGIGQTSFLEFRIETVQLKWIVGRRYSDFIFLRNYLVKAYPTVIIPPVPEKKAAKRTHRHIEKRMKILQFFLNDLASIREIFNDRFVEGFLYENDRNKFQSLKKQAEKQKQADQMAQHTNFQGKVEANLHEESKAFLDEMQEKIPQYQSLYKQITRGGKKLQNIITEEINCLYQLGNNFADLHERTRETQNKLPKIQPVTMLNNIFITMNNMMIEWGNIARSQYEFIQQNFNTFFKYVRNELYGFTDVINKEQVLEAEYAKIKAALEKKKQKIYNLHDASKWEMTSSQLSTLPKEVVHDKVEAVKHMLPRQSSNVDKMKMKVFYLIDQIFVQGIRNIDRTTIKYCENFKEFSINLKVNYQQMCEMWMEMSQNFSGPRSKPTMLMERPEKEKQEELYDD